MALQKKIQKKKNKNKKGKKKKKKPKVDPIQTAGLWNDSIITKPRSVPNSPVRTRESKRRKGSGSPMARDEARTPRTGNSGSDNSTPFDFEAWRVCTKTKKAGTEVVDVGTMDGDRPDEGQEPGPSRQNAPHPGGDQEPGPSGLFAPTPSGLLALPPGQPHAPNSFSFSLELPSTPSSQVERKDNEPPEPSEEGKGGPGLGNEDESPEAPTTDDSSAKEGTCNTSGSEIM
jgi:hypothetical protein